MKSSAARSVLSQAPPRRNEHGKMSMRGLRRTLAASVAAAGALALSALARGRGDEGGERHDPVRRQRAEQPERIVL